MPKFAGRPTASLRLFVIATALVVVAVLGFAPLGTAEDKPAPAAPAYAGADSCVACHDDVAAKQTEDWHSKSLANRPDSRNCEECHGPSAAHTEAPDTVRTNTNVTKLRASQSGAACLRCHEAQHRSLDWKLSDHARANVACWKCHSQGASPHSATVRKPGKDVCYSCHREQAATFELTSHHPVREGRVTCADCHNSHKRHQTVADTNKLCASCHAPQRGPFVFAHGALSGNLTEGCLDCHRPHGSPNGKLLKYAGRGVCLQCHADHALHFVGRTCWTSGCHADLHGSNTSPLLLGN